MRISYALQHQDGLKSMVTVGGYHNVKLMSDEMQRMKKELPPEVYRTLRKYEEAGDYENAEYLKAVTIFYRKHLCMLEEWPREVQYSLDHTNKLVYGTMNGPNEFTVIGNTRYWDASDNSAASRCRHSYYAGSTTKSRRELPGTCISASQGQDLSSSKEALTLHSGRKGRNS